MRDDLGRGRRRRDGRVSAASKVASRRMVRMEVIDGRQLAEAEPHLRAGLAGGLLRARRLDGLSAVRRRVLSREIRRDAVPAGGRRDRGAGSRARGDGTRVSAGITVNATGAWAPELTPGIEVRQRKGHLAITDRYPGFVRHVLVELGYLKSAHTISGRFVRVQRAAAAHRTGAARVLAAVRRRARDDRSRRCSRRMLRRCEEYMPGLAQLTAIRTWTGLPRGNTGQAAADRPDCAGPASVPRDGARGPRHHDVAGDRADWWRTASWGATPAIPIEPYLPGRKQEAH